MRDLVRQVLHALVGRAFHQPGLLRALCGLLARRPGLARIAPGRLVASREAVRSLLRRTGDFSHTAYASSLAAGEFLIGMDQGPRMLADRATLGAWIARGVPAAPAERPSVTACKAALHRLREQRRTGFDVIEDVLMEVAWSELKCTLGAAAGALEERPYRKGLDPPHLLDDLRYLGANLVVGWIAPRAFQEKVAACAARVRQKVAAHARALAEGLGHPPGPDDALVRNAVGMLWVGHPATVQAGALMIQELLARPAVHAALSARAQGLRQSAWTDPGLRADLREHVLELLRFRPVFPLVPRHAIRDTALDLGCGQVIAVKAGTRVVAGLVGAMFDAQAAWAPEVYHPARHREKWVREAEDEWLMFGLGERDCIARHLVPEILVSALIGLLLMPGLRWPQRRLFEPRIAYEGVIITRMPLACDPLG